MSSPTLILLSVNEVELLEDNPRDINQKEFEALCDDIKNDPNFLQQRPPLVNHITDTGKKVVYAGNQRLKAARHNGLEQIYFWVEENVSEEIQQKRMLQDNLHRGEWDFEKLKLFDANFLLDAGFKIADLNGMFNDILTISDDDFDIERAVNEIETPITKPGDLWILGNHRLLCGDSTKLEDVKTVCGNEQPRIVYSDPPYNIGYDYKKGFSDKDRYTTKQVKDDKTDEEYLKFIESTLANAKEVCIKDAHFFYWCDENYIGIIQQAYRNKSITPRRVCLWVKNNFNPVPQFAFNKIIEPCIYGTIGKPFLNKELKSYHEILNAEVGSANVIDDLMSHLQMWLVKKEHTNSYQHPTQKPIRLHEKPLKRCSAPGDIILDFFGGSGSTLISAEQLNRKAFLIEMDPVFCDVIIKRWQELTGRQAYVVPKEVQKEAK